MGRMLRALFVAVLPEVGLLPVQGLVENDQCASSRLTTSLAVVADSWAFNYPTAPPHGQLDGVLSHAMPEPNVETKLDKLCARMFRDEVNVTLVDIGANTGQTVTRLLHAWRDARAAPHIVAFEPGASAFAVLREKGKAWPTTVTLVNAAVSDAPGEVHFSVSGASENGHIDLSASPAGGAGDTVHVTTVDDFLRARRVARVHFLKIDTEGFEKLVLMGALGYLRQRRVRVLQFEYGLNWFARYASTATARATLEEVVRNLEVLGYETFYATPHALLRLGAPWDPAFELPRGLSLNTNIIALDSAWAGARRLIDLWHDDGPDTQRHVVPVCDATATAKIQPCTPERRPQCVSSCATYCRGGKRRTKQSLVRNCRCPVLRDRNHPRRDWRLDYNDRPLPPPPKWHHATQAEDPGWFRTPVADAAWLAKNHHISGGTI